jgi:hypothetical protein
MKNSIANDCISLSKGGIEAFLVMIQQTNIVGLASWNGAFLMTKFCLTKLTKLTNSNLERLLFNGFFSKFTWF